MPNILDVILRRNLDEPKVPACPQHKSDMQLRGKVGRPTRFSDQAEESYTLIYRCAVEGCNETAERTAVRTQIPVPGESPTRPRFARLDDD